MQNQQERVGDSATGSIRDAHSPEQSEQLIGSRIREIRTNAKMSATELGQKVGVSRSMISQIELGRTNASISVLRSIANALGVPLFTLFVEDRNEGEVVRRDQRTVLHIPGSDVVRELLVPDTHRKMTLLTAVFGPGERSSHEPSTHRGEECLVVIRGQMTVYYLGERIILDEGDSYYFDSTVPHLFANEMNEPAEIIAAICS